MYGVAAMVVAAVAAGLWAQQPAPAAKAGPNSAEASTARRGTVLDRVVAVVNGDSILESDIDEERRFEMIQPYRGRGEFSRERAVQLLVDRMLIQQEAEQQPDIQVTDLEWDNQIARLRKDIPACKEFHCETDAGWQRYLAENGFTESEFRNRWQTRMELLRFIQIRFQGGVQISDAQIKEYYEKTMLPEYQRQHVTPPKLEAISQRIAEVLLQQQVGNLLRDWLASLRAQGSVRIITQDEVGR